MLLVVPDDPRARISTHISRTGEVSQAFMHDGRLVIEVKNMAEVWAIMVTGPQALHWQECNKDWSKTLPRNEHRGDVAEPPKPPVDLGPRNRFN